ncbi:MAG: hypothetical protein K2M22_04410 [Lachnospiraceae bacterium]|nr:hypothetical protein [Lachnospiraceae bacterium]
MGLHKDGSRIGSAGVLKAERRDKTSVLTMTVKNIPHSIEGRFPVRYCFGADTSEQSSRVDWKEEDGITLRNGSGVWEKEETEGSERIYVQILLPNGYLVEGKSKAAVNQAPPKTVTSAPEPAITAPREPEAARPVVPDAEPAIAVPREPEPIQWDIPVAESTAAAPVKQSVSAAGSVAASSQPVVPQRPPLMADALAIEGLKEDKWEQILDTYDQIHPYGDDRVYVKIAPKDFIILSANCQHLVNNSFLLHGFYNYRYVILGRGDSVSTSEREYFLGVPGVFYEREKMVALMFGFEAFECEGSDPKPGDFGYYLRKVEL